jgi:hypothetical protein
MTSYEEDFDSCEPDERRFSPRLSLLIIVSLSAVGWWLLLPILRALFSLYGVPLMAAVIMLGLARVVLVLLRTSSKGVVPGNYYLSD